MSEKLQKFQTKYSDLTMIPSGDACSVIPVFVILQVALYCVQHSFPDFVVCFSSSGLLEWRALFEFKLSRELRNEENMTRLLRAESCSPPPPPPPHSLPARIQIIVTTGT